MSRVNLASQIALTILMLTPLAAFSQVAPLLGEVESFAVLGNSGVIGSTGLGTVVDGDVGSSPTTTISNFPPSSVLPPFTLHLTNNTEVQQARTDAIAAYNFILAQGPGTVLPAQLDGLVLTPGIYSFAGGAADLAAGGTLTLNEPGVFIFQVDSTLTANILSSVVGTADPCSVFWRVGTSATLNGVTFSGNVIAYANVGVGDGSDVTGRAIAGTGPTGAVTMVGNGGNTIGNCATPNVIDASLTIEPGFFDFMELDIDSPAECTDFTLGNTPGTDPLTIGTASVATPFSVGGNCDGSLLGGGETCVVEVCFDPNTEGTFSETLTVTSDVNDVAATVEGGGATRADISIDPPFGSVDLGVGVPAELITFNASATNVGSADAELFCTMAGDTAVISTVPDPLAGTVPAGGGSLDFSLQCDLPEGGGGGEEYAATLACDIDGEPAGEYVVACGISAFEPPRAVPTMQAWAMTLFALLMLLAGVIGIRYFRTG